LVIAYLPFSIRSSWTLRCTESVMLATLAPAFFPTVTRVRSDSRTHHFAG